MIPDKDLQSAARAYEKSRLASLPEPEDCPADFSPAFERRMRKLIVRVNHPVRYWLVRLLPLLAVAGIAAAAVALAGGEAAPEPEPVPPPAPVEPAEPAPEAEPETIVYRPTWMPEGWALDRETLYDGEGMLIYTNPDGGEATFLYATGGDPAQVPEDGTPVLVGENPGTLCLGQTKGELNDLWWTEGEASFWLSAPFAEEDLIRAAESVEKTAE